MSKTFINLGIKCILGKLWQESCQQQMILRKQRELRNSEKEASLTPSVFFLLACFLIFCIILHFSFKFVNIFIPFRKAQWPTSCIFKVLDTQKAVFFSDILVIFGACFSFWRRKWQPTPAFLPGKSDSATSLFLHMCSHYF